MLFVFSNGSGRLRRHPLNPAAGGRRFRFLAVSDNETVVSHYGAGGKVGCMPDTATYTHGHAESVLRSHRTRTAENSAAYLLPYLRAGQSLLDIGSGPGTITVDLAQRVAPGPVTAVEVTEAALAVTRAEFERRGLTSARLVTGDIHDLPFPSGSFDVVHAHQVLQHVADPVASLLEMVRVCCPAAWWRCATATTAGLGTKQDIDAIVAAWREWAAHPDGWISVLQGELLIRVPKPPRGSPAGVRPGAAAIFWSRSRVARR
jgi:SAM-dependent methyltransferase